MPGIACLCAKLCMWYLSAHSRVVNPQRACAARVAVLGLCVCVSVCLSVTSNLASRAIMRPTRGTNGFIVRWALK